MHAKPQFLEDTTFSFDHFVLQVNIIFVQYHWKDDAINKFITFVKNKTENPSSPYPRALY
jgi:hypothetical protein